MDIQQQNFRWKASSLQILLCCWFLCWASMKLLSFELWMGDRSYPLAPITESLQNAPLVFHAILFWTSIFLMVVSCIKTNRRLLLILFLLEITSCLLDQNRWQPFEYQFLLMLLPLIYYNNEKRIWKQSWQIIVIGVYFFSGIFKLHNGFIYEVWNNLFLFQWLGIETNNIWILRVGYLLGIVEALAAVLLLFKTTRKSGVCLLLIMHLMLLVALGPLGLNKNDAIWPWNIFMPVLLLFLFKNTLPVFTFEMIRKPLITFVIICSCLLPWLNFAGKWDDFLSFKMFTGGLPKLYICTSSKNLQPDYTYPVDKKIIPCSYAVNTFSWGFKSLHATPNPAKRIMIAFAKNWKKNHPQDEAVFYVYYSGFKANWELLEIDK